MCIRFLCHESVQRKGVGKMIFDYMLNYENKHPASLAYDRPTLRLLSFMKKNYGLKDYMTQNNSFMIYEQFFNQEGYPNNDTEFDNETFRVIQNLAYNQKFLCLLLFFAQFHIHKNQVHTKSFFHDN